MAAPYKETGIVKEAILDCDAWLARDGLRLALRSDPDNVLTSLEALVLARMGLGERPVRLEIVVKRMPDQTPHEARVAREVAESRAQEAARHGDAVVVRGDDGA